MKKIRLGILGIGNIGSSHAKHIVGGSCPEITLAAVCDIKPARLAWAKETLGADIPVFDDAKTMMESGLIDAVLVSVPHYDHPTYAMMAMAHGLHVLIEKPAGVYTKQVLEMNAFAAKHDVVFAIMMNQRTNPVYIRMRELVKSGRFGAIRRTNWIITDWYRSQAYYDSGDWRATWSGEGGGVLLNQCPHNLDLWQWICGMPERVSAHLHLGKWHDIEVEDDVTAYVEYANGATGVFVTTTGDAPGTNRFEVTLEHGKIVAEGGKLTTWYSEQSIPAFSAENTSPFGAPKFVVTEEDVSGEVPHHKGIMNAFAACILHGTPLYAEGTEGINGLLLSNAMHLSAWTGKTVSLSDFDHDLYYEELMKRVRGSRRKSEVKETVVSEMGGTFGS
ncbi:MAG: Gfo/Idh/MocA family oxidoreductase [Clostridia bacterium]|nr:Gfo/Idh/MocA family oxidoreductase [Clostridia bacterium]